MTFCDRARAAAVADLLIVECAAARHVIIGPAGEEQLVFGNADIALTLRLHGSRALLAPVSTTFLVRGIPEPQRLATAFSTLTALMLTPHRRVHRSRERLFLRDALVALDARRIGASYRETAAIIYGAERAHAAWSSASTAMKERMRPNGHAFLNVPGSSPPRSSR